MEKESKVLISSDDGEWSREPIQKLSQRGVRPLFLKRDSTLLLGKIREERPQLGRHWDYPHSLPRPVCGKSPLHSDFLLYQPHD